MNNQISLTVNGQLHSLDPIPGETLSALLRERLRLTGTKIGCEEAECGACTVLVEGEPVVSCIYPAERADGKTVVTIEGLSALPRKHRDDVALRLRITQRALRPPLRAEGFILYKKPSWSMARCSVGFASLGRL
jgi:aerobic-type carbon monoxide dehydrogenase small subunit (CoxS/CutS family)